MRIIVSIAPLEGLVRQLAPHAEVSLLVPAGVSEHGYELTPGDLTRLRRADLIVGVGLGLEPRLEEFARRLPEGSAEVMWFAQCLSAEDLAGDAPEHEPAHGHDHADEHGHDQHGVDPHLWLDPVLVGHFIEALGPRVEAVRARMGQTTGSVPGTAVDPNMNTDPARIREATSDLMRRVGEMDAACRAALEPLRGRAIVTHHASHGRFATRYGLRVVATIRLAEALEPTPGQVAEAVRAIRAEGVPAVFVEPQFDSTTAARIAQEAGVKVVVLDPMGDGDWFRLMQGTLDAITGALGDPSAAAAPHTGESGS